MYEKGETIFVKENNIEYVLQRTYDMNDYIIHNPKCKIVYAQRCKDAQLVIDNVRHMMGCISFNKDDKDVIVQIIKSTIIFIDKIPNHLNFLAEADLESKLKAIEIGLTNWYKVSLLNK